MTTKQTDKSLKDKAISIKGKDYVQVKDRIQFLADNYDWRYELESQYDYFPERKTWVVKASLIIWDEKHESSCVYEWLAQEVETEKYWQVNTTSALENAETSARWRACAAFWLWIDSTWGIASANEMQKALNREKALKEIADDTPFKDDEPSNPEPTRFEKAKQWVKFMQECLDEDDYIGKIKARVDEIWAKMTKQQETDLRICYNNAKAMENLPLN